MNAKLLEEKVFRDPIHGYVHVQEMVIDELIDTKEFQRLRRIKQLGTASLTFHGAEHSRFNHSLGVYELTRRIIDEIFIGRQEWDNNERLVALCAGLLHDLGHGPFSHSFEKVFGTDHEHFTQQIILGDTEVNQVLRQVASDFPKKIASVISKTYPNKLVISLISSQIDADRMDYLQRDAYYTGVSYGRFDLERMLRVIRPSKDGFVIKESGMHVVEDYIMSRYQMYRQVYFHPVSGSAEVLLTKIFQRAKLLYKRGYSFAEKPRHFEAFFNQQVDVQDYLKLDESVCTYYFERWQMETDEILSDLCDRFLHRRLLKSIPYDNKWNEERVAALAKRLRMIGVDPDYYLQVNASSNVPYDEYIPGKVQSKQPITLRMRDGHLEELSQQSTIVAAINGKKNIYQYLYFPLDKIKAAENEEIKAEILAMLK